MGSAKRQAAPAGLPGDKEQIRLRKEQVRRRMGLGVLGLGLWVALIVLVGPARVTMDAPPLGPAARDLVALRDFDAEEPVPDLVTQQEAAVAAIPLVYGFDQNAAARRIDALRTAFRLVRPRYRLFFAERERLVGSDHAVPAKPGRVGEADAVQGLDRAFNEEMERLRPEFESAVAPRRSELGPDVFATLRKAGFADEVELLLSDVAQVLLSQKIVREIERFEDDLQRGVLDAGQKLRYDKRSLPDKVVDVDQALHQADVFVAEFVRQKKPSRLDEPVLQEALRQLARGMVEPTFQRDLEATHTAEALARGSLPKTRVVRYTRGQSLVKRGDLVTAQVQERVSSMARGMQGDATLRAYLATALLLAVILGLFATFARRHLHHFRHRPRDVGLLATILVLHAASLRGWLSLGEALVEPGGTLTAEMWLVAMPMALGPSLAALFLKPFTAAPFALVCAALTAMMTHNSAFVRALPGLDGVEGVLALVVGLAGVQASRQFRTRADLFRSGVLLALSGLICAVAMVLFTVPTAGLLDSRNLLVLVGGLATGLTTYLLLTALTPLLESGFNRLTDIKLLELASMNHPALRLLATEAPGTFTHSVMVGNLAQTGCDAIGANGLLARVGAYYHDLGKTRAPRYFAENQGGDNPHDRIKPNLSALIIKSHVKDGIKILRDFRLPDEIIDFVPQHHGTSLIAHFYHRAQREAMDAGDDEIPDADFRYPGPKPQRRETAMLMIADAVEAAAKAMPDPNPSRVEALVKRIIAGKVDDGQLDECDLTLRELALVEQAFVKALLGMHHSRPTYLPAPQPAVASPQQLALPALVTTGEEQRPNTKRLPVRERRAAPDKPGTTGMHDRPTLTATINTQIPQHAQDAGDLDDDGAEPESPTALIVQKSPAPRAKSSHHGPAGS